MHYAWSNAAEQYLLSRKDMRVKQLPSERPRRGSTMPRTRALAANRLSHFTKMPRDTASDLVADLAGLTRDIHARLSRITQIPSKLVKDVHWYIPCADPEGGNIYVKHTTERFERYDAKKIRC